jgi:hypothetical protein
MKSKTEYTGIEAYVDEMLISEDISWLPINRSMAIEKNRGKMTDNIIAVEKLENAFDEAENLYLPKD